MIVAALFLSFAIFVACNTSISLALGLASVAALLVIDKLPLILVPQKLFTGIDSFALLAIPLFILSGNLMETGGISRRLVAVASAIVGHIRGGLAHVVVVSTVFFSDVSGASTADAAAIGSVCIPAMERKGYRRELATAIVAAAAGMGMLIPPCINMVVYAIVTGTSVGALFVGGFLPGFLMAFSLMTYIYFAAHRNPAHYPIEEKASLRDGLLAIKQGALPLMMPVIIMGGILSGITTVTESAAIAVAYAFLLSVFVYKELKISQLPGILVSTASTTGIVTLLIGMATLFGWILAAERIPFMVGEAISTISDHPWVFLFIMNVLFLAVGTFMDPLPAILILVPIFFPVATQLGIDPIHFGIIVIANMGIGSITPPVGPVLFVACSVGKVPIAKVLGPLVPFVGAMLIALILITYVPEITLLLPRLFGYVQG